MAIQRFFQELQRRNVIKAAISYIAVSWVILQAGSILFPTMKLSNSAMQVLLILLIVLFPAWLIFAWFYEYTPHGFKRTAAVEEEESIAPQTSRRLNAVIIGGLSLAVLLLLADRIFDLGGKMVAKEDLSIAVLPFENIGSEADAYFATGIAEDILTQLGKIGNLRVLSRFTLNEYDKKGKTPSQIGKELNVTYLLTGSVRRAGDDLRIICELIRTKDETQTWSENYDRVMADVFKIQSDIANRIANKLKATLTPAEKERIEAIPTKNLAAYNIYLKGREEYNKNDRESNDRAMVYFKQATALDPSFGVAWAGLADTYTLASWWHENPSLSDTALMLAQRAVELDEQSADTWKALGVVQGRKFNLSAAKANYEKALERNPNHFQSLTNLANLFAREGNLVEAVRLYKKTLTINPLYSEAYSGLGGIYTDLELYDQSTEQNQKSIELDGDDPNYYYRLAVNYYRMKDYAQLDQVIQKLLALTNNHQGALLESAAFTLDYDAKKAATYLEKAMADPDYNENLTHNAPMLQAYLLLQAGKRSEAEVILQRRLKYHQARLKEYPRNMWEAVFLANAYVSLGDTENAIVWLEKYFQWGGILATVTYKGYEGSPEFRSLNNNPRFKALMEEARQQVAKMRAEVLAMEAKEQKTAFRD